MASTTIDAGAFETDFKCPSCGFASPVRVDGLAKDKDAADDPRAVVDAMLANAACKRCGRRQGVGVYWRDNLLLGVVVAGALWGLGRIAPEGRESASLVPVIQVVGALAVLFAIYLRWLTVTETGGRVHFVEPEEDAGDAPPKPRKKKRKKKSAPAPDAVEAKDV